jgi:hypothetical protein
MKNRKERPHNERFGVMAAVTPQTILYEIERYYPAASSVKPPPRKAAGTLPASGRQRGGERLKTNKNKVIHYDNKTTL